MTGLYLANQASKFRVASEKEEVRTLSGLIFKDRGNQVPLPSHVLELRTVEWS